MREIGQSIGEIEQTVEDTDNEGVIELPFPHDILIRNFTGILGNVDSSQVQIGDYNSVHAELKRRGLSQAERNELETILDALERLDQQVGRMEAFGAQPMEPFVACLSEIENGDLFVGIYAHRYGYIPTGSTTSITEAEFRHARNLNKPTFCFVVEANHPWPPEMIESEPGRTKFVALKTAIACCCVRDTFTTPDNISFKIETLAAT